MTNLFLNLYRTNEKTFQFDLPQNFTNNNNLSIAVVKIDGILDMNEVNSISPFVYLSCNLICDTFIDERQSNIICKFNANPKDKKITFEPINLIYHKTVNNCNLITLKLVDEKNNLIDFNKCDLHIELHVK